MTRQQLKVVINSYLEKHDVSEELLEEIEGFLQIAFEEGYSEGYKDAEDYFEVNND